MVNLTLSNKVKVKDTVPVNTGVQFDVILAAEAAAGSVL